MQATGAHRRAEEGRGCVMTLKPPTRTLPKLVMKEWPERGPDAWERAEAEQRRIDHEKRLADFTRVVEETGILDQEEAPLTKRESKHD